MSGVLLLLLLVSMLPSKIAPLETGDGDGDGDYFHEIETLKQSYHQNHCHHLQEHVMPCLVWSMINFLLYLHYHHHQH